MNTVPAQLPEVQEHIDKCGQHLFGVGGNPPFIYTIGNANHGLPELLIIGPFHFNDTGLLLNMLGAKMRETGEPLSGEFSFGGQFPVKVREASEAAKSEWTIQAGQYLGHENYSVLQVLLCDKNGVYPGEPGIDADFDVPLV